MRINVKVIPSAKIAQIQQSIDGNLKVWLKSKPVDGKANRELIALLADYYKVKKSEVQIVSGLTARKKIVNIESL